MLYQLPITPQNLLFLIYVAWNRVRIRLSTNTHPTSDPFISGDGFRALAEHIFEDGTDFDPSRVKKNDLVFVSLPRIKEFFRDIHPQIKSAYRLLSHNGDVGISKEFAQYADSKISHWWTQNLLFSHPKISPIPIGLENLSYFNHGIPSLFKRAQQKKKARILYGFSVSTNLKVRSRIEKILQRTKVAQKIPARLNSAQYVRELSKYKFVASPPGNGEDCIRTWEAMYVGVIPIVSRSFLTEAFELMGLPLLIIDDWNTIQNWDESDLSRIYEFIMKKSDRTALYFKYWRHKIRNTYGIKNKNQSIRS